MGSLGAVSLVTQGKAAAAQQRLSSCTHSAQIGTDQVGSRSHPRTAGTLGRSADSDQVGQLVGTVAAAADWSPLVPGCCHRTLPSPPAASVNLHYDRNDSPQPEWHAQSTTAAHDRRALPSLIPIC